MCTNLTPIPSKCDSKVLWGKVLVKGSARLFTLSMFSTTTSRKATMSRMMWYFLSMCFPFLWFFGSLDYATTPLLSQNNVLWTCSILITPRSERNFLSRCHFTSSKIFSLHYGVSNTRLLNTPPTYGSTSQGEHTTWSGLSKIKIWLKIWIHITNWYQILTPVNKHIIFCSP